MMLYIFDSILFPIQYQYLVLYQVPVSIPREKAFKSRYEVEKMASCKGKGIRFMVL